MSYINDIYIQTFKGVENLKLSNLGDINILVGNNNTCKTSLLEAIQLFEYPDELREVIRIARIREIMKRRPGAISIMESFLNIFNAKQEENKKISLKCNIDNESHLLEIKGIVDEVYVINDEFSEYKDSEFNEETPIREFLGTLIYNNNEEKITMDDISAKKIYRNSAIGRRKKNVLKVNSVSSADYLNEAYSLRNLSEAIKKNEKLELLTLLKNFDDKIDGIEILPSKTSPFPITYIKHLEYGFMPLSSFGDGIKKVLTLASAVLRIENGVLLIDEIETAIHTSALNNVFRWLLETCKLLNIQIIATTHSDEAIRNLLLAYKDLEYNMCIYRLERYEEEVISRRFSGEKAYDIVVNSGGDLR
ncbi:MAG: AAA family ATPase [Sarcina sp.]